MSARAGQILVEQQNKQFAGFTLDLQRASLWRSGQEIKLRPKSYEVLKYLVENPGKLVTKDELIQAVWPDSFVTDNSLVQCLHDIRRALGKDAQRLIKTVPRRGYIFDADVVETEPRALETVLTDNADELKLVIEEQTDSRHFSLGWVTLLALAVLASFGILKLINHAKANLSGVKLSAPFQNVQTTQITNLGNVWGIGISPDGQYLVYALEESGRDSLWLRQTRTESNQQIVPPANVRYFQLTFSRDGNYIYYAERENEHAVVTINRVATLGGVPTKLVSDAQGDFALSPDNTQICFVRDSSTESKLMLARLNGEERLLAKSTPPERLRYPAWSPDGQVIVASNGNFEVNGLNNQAVAVRLADGTERLITNHPWHAIEQKIWSSDGRGLFMIAGDQTNRPYQRQVWFLSYPEGRARQITNDAGSYACLSLTKDSRTLATMQTSLESSIWMTEIDDPNNSHKLATGAGGFSWTPDGKVVYASHANGSKEIWIMNADGSERKQLTLNNGFSTSPDVSPDGQQIVYASDRGGTLNLWKMKIDGTDSVQLTNGNGEDHPIFTPDGGSLIYSSEGKLWQMPGSGGQATELSGRHSEEGSLSPDGKWLAYFGSEEQPGLGHVIVVAPAAGGPPQKIFSMPPQSIYQSPDVHWMPDSQSLTYVATRDGVSNVWSQSLGGGPPRQLTRFLVDTIFYFDVSPTGQKIVCSRGGWAHDMILIKSVE